MVLSPANKAYLDMPYDEDSPPGPHWAGYVEAAACYDWDPSTAPQSVGESSIAGVEAPLRP